MIEDIPSWIFGAIGLAIAFPLIWIPALLFTARKGWTGLARAYPATPSRGQAYPGQTLSIGAGGRYGKSITVTVDDAAIHLHPNAIYRPFHADISIPWRDVAALERVGGTDRVLLITSSREQVTIEGRAASALTDGFASNRGTPAGAPAAAASDTGSPGDAARADKDGLLFEIGKRLLASPVTAEEGWRGIALVGTAERDAVAAQGFAYFDRAAPTPLAPDDELARLATALRRVMMDGGDGAWRHMVYRLWLPGPDFRAEFDYDGTALRAVPEAAARGTAALADAIDPRPVA